MSIVAMMSCYIGGPKEGMSGDCGEHVKIHHQEMPLTWHNWNYRKEACITRVQVTSTRCNNDLEAWPPKWQYYKTVWMFGKVATLVWVWCVFYSRCTCPTASLGHTAPIDWQGRCACYVRTSSWAPPFQHGTVCVCVCVCVCADGVGE